ncbi:MAG TPA: response regulator, partial [Kofleriaceae bacterium]|nr:response regulator [Kofleriaceae bacterium]
MTAPPRARLLIVDDEPELLESLTDLLRRDAEVRTAVGGEAALELASRFHPQVVVSDMRMPGMDGAELLARIREREPDAVRILLTGYTDLEAALRAVNEGGVFRFLTKPCPPSTLRKALRDAVEQHRMVTADRELMAARLGQLSSQLVHAERLATLGTMSAAMAHEMNNALTLLTPAIYAVKRAAEAGQPPDAEDIAHLMKGRDRLLAHSRQVLAVARRRPRAIEDVDVSELIREVAALLRDVGVTKRVAVALELPDAPARVAIDAGELEQIVLNLAKNAVDALTEGGGGHLTLRVAVDEARVTLEVADDGCGIPPESLRQIWEPYFTTKPPGAGTGLGLPVVRSLVESHDGTI